MFSSSSYERDWEWFPPPRFGYKKLIHHCCPVESPPQPIKFLPFSLSDVPLPRRRKKRRRKYWGLHDKKPHQGYESHEGNQTGHVFLGSRLGQKTKRPGKGFFDKHSSRHKSSLGQCLEWCHDAKDLTKPLDPGFRGSRISDCPGAPQNLFSGFLMPALPFHVAEEVDIKARARKTGEKKGVELCLGFFSKGGCNGVGQKQSLAEMKGGMDPASKRPEKKLKKVYVDMEDEEISVCSKTCRQMDDKNRDVLDSCDPGNGAGREAIENATWICEADVESAVDIIYIDGPF